MDKHKRRHKLLNNDTLCDSWLVRFVISSTLPWLERGFRFPLIMFIVNIFLEVDKEDFCFHLATILKLDAGAASSELQCVDHLRGSCRRMLTNSLAEGLHLLLTRVSDLKTLLCLNSSSGWSCQGNWLFWQASHDWHYHSAVFDLISITALLGDFSFAGRFFSLLVVRFWLATKNTKLKYTQEDSAHEWISNYFYLPFPA